MKKYLTFTILALLTLGSALVFTGCHHHHHGPKRSHERRIKPPRRDYRPAKPGPRKPAPKKPAPKKPAPKPHRR